MSKKLLGEIELNRIYQRDCIEGMRLIPDKSVDMILCDLPYGTTACKWDTLIPFEPLWQEYERIIKDDGAIVLTARQPFTTVMISSNLKLFKYCWVWNKKQSGSPHLAKYMPLQINEDVVVFGKGKLKYFPIMRKGVMRKKGGNKKGNESMNVKPHEGVFNDLYYPTNILEIANPRMNKLHPTEKPLKLFEYLLKTYTNEGDVVLDNCMGSGTTAVACVRNNRNFIGFELEREYVEIANKRLDAETEVND